MNLKEKEKITLSLIETFNKAGNLALDLRLKGLKKEIKSDNTPVSNGDLEVNKLLSSKIKEITPNIAIVSEENSEHKNDKNFTIIKPPFEIPEIELKMIWSPLLHHDASHIWFRQLVIAAAIECQEQS